MSDQAAAVIRHVKRGKVHRYNAVQAVPSVGTLAACGYFLYSEVREVVQLAQTAEEDRCTRCWPSLRA